MSNGVEQIYECKDVITFTFLDGFKRENNVTAH
jgi:hypothetical protein